MACPLCVIGMGILFSLHTASACTERCTTNADCAAVRSVCPRCRIPDPTQLGYCMPAVISCRKSLVIPDAPQQCYFTANNLSLNFDVPVSQNNISQDTCMDACSSIPEMVYFGLRADVLGTAVYISCLCGSQVLLPASNVTPTLQCATSCPGNTSQTCGSLGGYVEAWRMDCVGTSSLVVSSASSAVGSDVVAMIVVLCLVAGLEPILVALWVWFAPLERLFGKIPPAGLLNDIARF